MKCEKCGTIAMPEDQFCGACGAPLLRAQPATLDTMIHLTAATQASLNTAYLHYRLGMVYYKQGKLKEAIESWKHTLDVDPNHQEAETMLSRATLEVQITPED